MTNLHGRVKVEEILGLDRSELVSSIQTLAVLPQGLSETQLSIVAELLLAIPKLCEAAASLNRSIKRTEALETLQSVELLLQVATQIANAPAVSAGAFLSSRWENEVERANDIAEALANLEKAKEIVGNQVSDAGWQADLSEATGSGTVRYELDTLLQRPLAPAESICEFVPVGSEGSTQSQARLAGCIATRQEGISRN